jgi:cellulose synthase/poly-beta-1,6-N-acetylglucosamine synthase-like glycosyltransferase
MIAIFKPTLEWIKDDYKTSPFRFILELAAWAISIGCSITMAATVPNPPLIILYPIWIVGCAIYAWAAFTRKSFGMLANYVLLVSIDSIGLIRMLAKYF